MLRARFNGAAPEFVDKMEASSGIRTRWYAPEDWATSDLAVRAATIALNRAGKTADEVDLILVGTDSPDFITPATSVIVQDKLGAKRAGTFDVGCACASFPTAISNAAGLMATNPALNSKEPSQRPRQAMLRYDTLVGSRQGLEPLGGISF